MFGLDLQLCTGAVLLATVLIAATRATRKKLPLPHDPPPPPPRQHGQTYLPVPHHRLETVLLLPAALVSSEGQGFISYTHRM
jgi:hypothetical protein